MILSKEVEARFYLRQKHGSNVELTGKQPVEHSPVSPLNSRSWTLEYFSVSARIGSISVPSARACGADAQEA